MRVAGDSAHVNNPIGGIGVNGVDVSFQQAAQIHLLRPGEGQLVSPSIMLGILGDLWRAGSGRSRPHTWSNGVPMDIERAPHLRSPADLRPGCS